jgi:hypothetical protein
MLSTSYGEMNYTKAQMYYNGTKLIYTLGWTRQWKNYWDRNWIEYDMNFNKKRITIEYDIKMIVSMSNNQGFTDE